MSRLIWQTVRERASNVKAHLADSQGEGSQCQGSYGRQSERGQPMSRFIWQTVRERAANAKAHMIDSHAV
jgi:hypothetical protein